MAKAPPSNPVIFVPGITATYLRDDYSLPPDTIWSVLTQDYERASLHPDNLKYEALEPARVQPGQLYEVAYKEIVDELRFNLRETEDRPVPVFPFGYDWRQPLEATEDQLGQFVTEVIERTKLLRHYANSDYMDNPRVNLVGHSMGGLIIAGWLARNGKSAPVGKVATLATPFQGSFEAVIKVTTGTANLGTSPPTSREREAARATPALYYLMPSFKSGIDFGGIEPPSLFDIACWQGSILSTIEEYIRLKGLQPAGRSAQAKQIFSGMLAAAETHRKRVDSLALQKCGLKKEDWLCIVGVDSVTRVALQLTKTRSGPDFNFASSDRANKWQPESDGAPVTEADRRMTGDGTVPFEGAVPKFLGLENLVCLSPDDFGYWELGDKALAKVAGFHGILPNMDVAHRLVVRHFTGRADRHGNTWGRRAPGVDATQWAPPIVDLKDKS